MADDLSDASLEFHIEVTDPGVKALSVVDEQVHIQTPIIPQVSRIVLEHALKNIMEACLASKQRYVRYDHSFLSWAEKDFNSHERVSSLCTTDILRWGSHEYHLTCTYFRALRQRGGHVDWSPRPLYEVHLDHSFFRRFLRKSIRTEINLNRTQIEAVWHPESFERHDTAGFIDLLMNEQAPLYTEIFRELVLVPSRITEYQEEQGKRYQELDI
jgi:hypothetical protein